MTATDPIEPHAEAPEETGTIINSGFESGDLHGWKTWRTRRAEIVEVPYEGSYAVALGPEIGQCAQEITIKPNSRYRLTAWVRTESGSEEVMLIASDFGGEAVSASSALTEYFKLSVEFSSAYASDTLVIMLKHPAGSGRGYADQVELEYLGEAEAPVLQEFIPQTVRTLQEEGGVVQQSDDKMAWYLDAKFGMFIHWGVYAAFDEGSEWVMENKAYTPEYYRERAEDPVNGFLADQFDPAAWAALAKKAGMKYMSLTSRHHDGYALFDSRHSNSWTSVQHLGRDLIKEYTDAVRASGLHVGLYYSPMSWRYPGYYNVTGDDCKPNTWGYTNEAWHKTNARLLKEEVYEQVKMLLSNYGKIEYMFWDGAWLGQSLNAELETRFWDPGMYQDPAGDWPVSEIYTDQEEGTGKPLGIMGMVRKHQPDLIVNERFSWVGDVGGEEGVSTTVGDIRNERYMEKCFTLQKGGWGYRPGRPVYSFEEVVVFLSNCAVRNLNLLLNVAPDRHGVIPAEQQEVLLQMGSWLSKVGDAVYNTRGGPWQPLSGEYGFTYNSNKIYCYIFTGYRDKQTATFTTQSIAAKTVTAVKNLYSGESHSWVKNGDNTVTVSGVDYSLCPFMTILEITLSENVY